MQAAAVAQRTLGRTRWGLIALLLALAMVAWVASDLRMAGMDAGPGADLGSLGFYTSVWVVMMAAMMFPSAAPMVVGSTPAKDVCLRKCRTPLDFVLGHWRDGYAGALRMGAEHGAWCVGCCWALMAALFALGAMSLGWMAFVAALIALEKLAPRPLAAKRGVAVLLAVLALGVAIAPESVPGLTLPSETDGMRMTAGM